MSTSGLEYVTLDVFTETRFGGNPLGLILVPEGKAPSQEEKQKVAREFNYSETVFLHLSEKSTENAEFKYDIFTVDQELPFAGHPTIGTAWYIAKLYPHLTTARLLAKAGPVELSFDRRPDGTVYASADIPHNVHHHSSRLQRADLLKMQPALAQFEAELASEGSPIVSIVKGMTFAYIRISSMEALRAIQLCPVPTSDFVTLDEAWAPSFVASYFYYVDEGKGAEKRNDVKLNCRMIESQFGEDPATGSGAAGLAAYLAMEDAKKGSTGESHKFEIDQGVELGRPSKIRLEVKLNEDGKPSAILEAGCAVQIMAGRLI